MAKKAASEDPFSFDDGPAKKQDSLLDVMDAPVPQSSFDPLDSGFSEPSKDLASSGIVFDTPPV